MCGIVGYIGDKWNEGQLRKAVACLQHRGPDAEGFFTDKNCGLGHRRLAIIDLSEEAGQPFHDASGRYVLIFNGEIYNFRQVRNQLNFTPRTDSDTEVILEAYKQWGDDFVHQLNGMFAMAIYDRESGTLKLWRDRVGIKPLYYFWDGKSFAFASEIKALLQLGIPKKIRKEAIGDFLFLESIPAPLTIYEQVCQLENGHQLILNQRKLEEKTWYYLPEKVLAASSTGNEKEHTEAFLSAFRQSVQHRLVSDVPVGAFLSGGADSSMVCAMFNEVASSPFEALTIGFEDAAFDETDYARKVAGHLGINHEVRTLQGTEALEIIQKLAGHYDQPYASGSAIPSLLVCRETRKNVTVALSGDGGDELFMGYGHYHWYRRLKKMNKLGGKLGRKLTAAMLRQMDHRKQRAARVIDYEEPFWLSVWSQEQYMFSQKEISALLGNTYKHQTLNGMWNKIEELPVDFETKISYFDILHYLPNNLLHKMDVASMAHSLEVRLPFLDHELVERMMRVPTELKLHGDTDKYLLKKGLGHYLPDPLIYRKKWGFPAPVGAYMKKDIRFLVDRLLNKDRLKQQDIFDPNEVHRYIDAFMGGKHYHEKRVWALLEFQLWYEEYMA